MPYGSESTIDPLLTDAGWARRLGRSLARDRHAADDAAQDAWVAVLEGRMAAGAHPRRWLAKVARNFALLGMRKEQAVRRAERAAARSESREPDPGLSHGTEAVAPSAGSRPAASDQPYFTPLLIDAQSLHVAFRRAEVRQVCANGVRNVGRR